MTEPTHVSWLENDAVRRYVNRSMTGSDPQSAIEHFMRGTRNDLREDCRSDVEAAGSSAT